MSDPTGQLPTWAAEVADLGKVCRHCGDKLTVCTQLAWLGENGSYFCDPEKMEVGHEPETN